MDEDEVLEWLDEELGDLLDQIRDKLGDDNYLRANKLLVEAASNV